MSQISFWITNNTNHTLTIEGFGNGNMVLSPICSTNWTVDNGAPCNKDLILTSETNDVLLRSTLSFDTNTGVFVDKGPLVDDAVNLIGDFNGTQWITVPNGGISLASPSDLTSNDQVFLVFY